MRFREFGRSIGIVSMLTGTHAIASLAQPQRASRHCVDAESAKPFEVSGRLVRRVFPGPPNYENVKHGDIPESAWIILLSAPVCIAGDKLALKPVSTKTIQLLPDGDLQTPVGILQRLRGRYVTLRLKQSFAAQTGHHHAPIVATVEMARWRGAE